MDTPRMLSGEELVARGVTKILATLPDIGMKDVMPNGSWLEQKQIQAAIEARKHLIEVERIEKFGTLSQAEWRDDVKLAEVTRQAGSYWQFFGHHIGKKLYLRCEEALFLMEVNCLQLKHNEVTVSLQKGYSLLLDKTFSINHYKVYSSLSRLGYKVYRHKDVRTIVNDIEKKSEPITADDSNNDSTTKNIGNDEVSPENKEDISISTNKVDENSTIMNENSTTDNETHMITSRANIILDIEGNVHNSVEGENTNIEAIESNRITNVCEIEVPSSKGDNAFYHVNGNSDNGHNSLVNNNTLQNNNSVTGEQNVNPADVEINQLEIMDISQNFDRTDTRKFERTLNNEMKLQKLLSRRLKPAKNSHKALKKLPEMAKKDIVYINTPEDNYIPKNIFVNKTTYKLNLENVKMKNHRSSTESTYAVSDEENRSLRRIRHTSRSETPQNNITPFLSNNMRLPRINQQFRPFLFWRPRPHFNFIHFNTFYPRQFLQNSFHPRFQFNIRPNLFLRPFSNIDLLDSNDDNENSFHRAPKRPKNLKQYHLQTLKNLAAKVKNHILSGNIVMPGNTHIQTIQALHKFLFSYNLKFKSKLRLTPQFDLVDETNVVETIELDCEEEIKRKKPRLEEDSFNENLNKLRQIALQLRNLEAKGISTSRHRRAFSSAVKTFNKSNNADVYLNDKYEMIDRRHITLDSSSDTECVVKENKKRQKKKKLRNPFYILKRLSEKQNNDNASTSKIDNSEIVKEVQNISTSRETHKKLLLEKFNANWLPKDDDFGRVEICPRNNTNTCIMNSFEDELLYDFLKSHTQTYNNWVEGKIAFLKYLKEINKQHVTEHRINQAVIPENQSGLRSIIGPHDSSDMSTILKKLRTISSNNAINGETNIKIDFDVYNRDIQHFRKSNVPKPHFRIACFDDSSTLPSGADIATLNAKYKDGIAIVFAIVGVGSISYLQINPIDLPVYIPINDLP